MWKNYTISRNYQEEFRGFANFRLIFVDFLFKTTFYKREISKMEQ